MLHYFGGGIERNSRHTVTHQSELVPKIRLERPKVERIGPSGRVVRVDVELLMQSRHPARVAANAGVGRVQMESHGARAELRCPPRIFGSSSAFAVHRDGELVLGSLQELKPSGAAQMPVLGETPYWLVRTQHGKRGENVS